MHSLYDSIISKGFVYPVKSNNYYIHSALIVPPPLLTIQKMEKDLPVMHI